MSDLKLSPFESSHFCFLFTCVIFADVLSLLPPLSLGCSTKMCLIGFRKSLWFHFKDGSLQH